MSLAHTKRLLIHHFLQYHCHCAANKWTKSKNDLDGQPSSLLAGINVSNYKATFFPINLVFLELDTDQPHLDFKILDEKTTKLSHRQLSPDIK